MTAAFSPWRWAGAAGLLAAAWLVVMRGALTPLPGDEGIYLYGARLVSEGVWPYRDFFLAHPPLRVLLAGALLRVGLPLGGVKLLVLLCTPAAALLLGWAVRRRAGPWAGLLTLFVYLFSTLNLELGGILLGPNLGAALLAGTLAAALGGRFLLAGVLLSLAGLQALYALMPGPVLLVWAWREGRARRFLVGCAVFPAVFAVLAVVAGAPFIDQVLRYHVQKVTHRATPYPVGRVLRFLEAEAGLLILGASGLVCAERGPRLIALAGFFCVAVTASYRSMMLYYFMVAFPFLAVSAGLGAAALAARARERRRWAIGAVTAVAAICYLPHAVVALDLDADRATQAQETDALVALVAERPPPSGALFGDGAVVPLVALRTGMRVAGHMVDTNAKRFGSQVTRPEEALAAVFAGEPPGVLLLEHHGAWLIPAIRTAVEDRLAHTATFDFESPGFHYRCRYYLPSGAPPAPPLP